MAALKAVVLLIIGTGIGLRFVNLDNQPYWMDEAFTSLRVSGHRPSEVKREAFTGNEITIKDLQKYQRVNSDRGIFHTALSLAASDPQHPPLYFVTARLWAGSIGDTPFTMRALAVLIGTFMIPGVYWLSLELFQSRLTAWIAMLFVAVSPFQFVYAQEARPYSLLGLATILSSAALFRAIRLQAPRAWWLYTCTAILGLYTHLFFSAVFLAQGIFMTVLCWKERGERRSTWMAFQPFLKAAAVSLLVFFPWLIVIVIRMRTMQSSTGWMREDLALSDLIKAWVAGLSYVFVDVKFDLAAPWSNPMRIPILILSGWAMYFFCRRTNTRSHLFILLLISCTAIPLIVPDLIIGGRRSSVSRYWMVAYLGLQVAVAHLLATQLQSGRLLRKRVGLTITASLVVAGLASCAIITQADTWRHKGNGRHTRELARALNQAKNPLLIGSCSPGINLGHVLSLTHLLNSNVRMRLTENSQLPPLPDQLDGVFVLNPSKKLRMALEQTFKSQTLVQLTSLLWRVDEKPN